MFVSFISGIAEAPPRDALQTLVSAADHQVLQSIDSPLVTSSVVLVPTCIDGATLLWREACWVNVLTFQETQQTWARGQVSTVSRWEAQVFSRFVLNNAVCMEGDVSCGGFHIV